MHGKRFLPECLRRYRVPSWRDPVMWADVLYLQEPQTLWSLLPILFCDIYLVALLSLEESENEFPFTTNSYVVVI